MRELAAEHIRAGLPDTSLVLDVGGGASPWRRADWVIDGLAFGEQWKLGNGSQRSEVGGLESEETSNVEHRTSNVGRGVVHSPQTTFDSPGTDLPPRFTSSTWVQWDLCERRPWPFSNGQFDFASCTHVLEDLRDPVWVCSEMMRVAKAGYIETPSRAVEQLRGVEHPLYAGFYHHRWLVSEENGALCFRFKPHSLHACGKTIVADLSAWQEIRPVHANMCFDWSGTFACREVLEFDEDAVNTELCVFAERARSTSGLVGRRNEPWRAGLARWWYYRRLKSNQSKGVL